MYGAACRHNWRGCDGDGGPLQSVYWKPGESTVPTAHRVPAELDKTRRPCDADSEFFGEDMHSCGFSHV